MREVLLEILLGDEELAGFRRAGLPRNCGNVTRRTERNMSENSHEPTLPVPPTAMDSETIIALNREQTVSERDTFTVTRYITFLNHLRRGTVDVLDVGCNTGRGGAAMKAHMPGIRLVGLDCVAERVNKLDPTVYQRNVVAFSHDVPLPSGSFDAIVAGEFIEHVPPAYVLPSLCEFFRLLRLKGQMLLTTPNPRYIRNRIQGRSVLLDPSHVSQHTASSLRRWLEDVGFSTIRIYGTGRVSELIGPYFPVRCLYGSYLAVARKW